MRVHISLSAPIGPSEPCNVVPLRESSVRFITLALSISLSLLCLEAVPAMPSCCGLWAYKWRRMTLHPMPVSPVVGGFDPLRVLRHGSPASLTAQTEPRTQGAGGAGRESARILGGPVAKIPFSSATFPIWLLIICLNKCGSCVLCLIEQKGYSE